MSALCVAFAQKSPDLGDREIALLLVTRSTAAPGRTLAAIPAEVPPAGWCFGFSGYLTSYNPVDERSNLLPFPMTEPVSENTTTKRPPIVYFDGVCGLCNHSVNWLLARDPEHRLRFAPLQGVTAAAEVPAEIRNRLDTLVFVRDGKVHIRTSAVSRILMTLKGRWRILGVMLWIIPLPLRDLGYRIVSRLRYRMFGKHDACRLPTAAERAVFLD